MVPDAMRASVLIHSLGRAPAVILPSANASIRSLIISYGPWLSNCSHNGQCRSGQARPLPGQPIYRSSKCPITRRDSDVTSAVNLWGYRRAHHLRRSSVIRQKSQTGLPETIFSSCPDTQDLRILPLQTAGSPSCTGAEYFSQAESDARADASLPHAVGFRWRLSTGREGAGSGTAFEQLSRSSLYAAHQRQDWRWQEALESRRHVASWCAIASAISPSSAYRNPRESPRLAGPLKPGDFISAVSYFEVDPSTPSLTRNGWQQMASWRSTAFSTPARHGTIHRPIRWRRRRRPQRRRVLQQARVVASKADPWRSSPWPEPMSPQRTRTLQATPRRTPDRVLVRSERLAEGYRLDHQLASQ